MKFDITRATVKVIVTIQHTAMESKQEVEISLEELAAAMIELQSKILRQQMARQAVMKRGGR